MKDTFPNTYAYLKKDWKNIGNEAFELLTRKGVYPYEYMDCWDKMKQTILPSNGLNKRILHLKNIKQCKNR